MEKQINEPILISLSEAARLTGTSTTTWRHWLASNSNQMPPVRIKRLGRAVRIHYGDLLQWIDEGSTIKRKRGRPRKYAAQEGRNNNEK